MPLYPKVLQFTSLYHPGCTKPVLYLSANMRSVLLPADTKAGTVIYRLRASDADDQYPISFGVVGENSIFKIGDSLKKLEII